MVNGDFPNGWTQVFLPDVCKIQTGKKDVDEGNPKGTYPFFTCAAMPTKSDFYSFDGESILLPGNGANVGVSIFYRGKFEAYQRTYVLNQFTANIKYVFYYLQGFWRKHLEGKQYGSAINYVRIGNFTSFQIPLAPLSEQERIVAKIEELFTQLDAGTAALHRVKAEVKRYKASVLKAACEGKLLENREVENSNGLPEGWKWSTVAELAADEPYSITDGPFGSKLKTEHYTDSGPRVIRLQNISDGEFRDEKAHISKEHFATLKRHKVYAGDLVIAGMGVSLPRACMIPEYVGDAIVKADCIRFKPNPNIADVKYMLFALNSETVKKLVAKIVHGIGRPRLNQQEIKAIPIPLPPLEEQRRIVAEVERRLSLAAGVESTLAASLSHAARLRQSVLKSAFEGRLA